jgi:hypothetical protein
MQKTKDKRPDKDIDFFQQTFFLCIDEDKDRRLTQKEDKKMAKPGQGKRRTKAAQTNDED